MNRFIFQFNQKRIGFTLAEVLITLGIIGVVAAMTLPTLIHNNQKKEIETKLKKFYSNMNQAIMLSEVENGDKKDWVFNTTECNTNTYGEQCLTQLYDKYLAKYLKTTKVKFSPDRGLLPSDGGLHVYFADGSAAIIGFRMQDYGFYTNAAKINANNLIERKDRFLFGFYPNGIDENRNENFRNKGIEPYINLTWDGTREGLKTDWVNYTKLIQLNNWEIPDDYPVKI